VLIVSVATGKPTNRHANAKNLLALRAIAVAPQKMYLHCVYTAVLFFCKVCEEQQCTRDLSGDVGSFEPCPRCHHWRSHFYCVSDRKKVEKLIKESPCDPHLANWLSGRPRRDEEEKV
jgi:hypothetical protein